MNRLNETVAESELQRGLDCGELIRLYQPIVELADGGPAYVEALLRWEHPARGCLTPSEFLVDEDDSALARAHRVVGRDRSGAARGPTGAARTPTDRSPCRSTSSAGHLERRDLSARVEHLLLDNDVPGPHALAIEVSEQRIFLSHRARARDRLTAAAQPRCRDRRRRLRRVGGRDRRRGRRAARLVARAARVAPGLPARRGEARPALRPTRLDDDDRRRRRRGTRRGPPRGRARRRGRADASTRARRRASISRRDSSSTARTARVRGRSARVVDERAVAAGWVAWPHGRSGPVRRARDALHVRAVLGGAAHDAQPVRRRGPRAGDVPARLPRVRWVQGRHQPQGLALQDPHQHLHQLVPGQEAPPRRGRPRRHRGLLPVPPPRRARGGGGRAAPPRPRCSTASPTRW